MSEYADECPKCEDEYFYANGMKMCRCDEEWFFDMDGKA